MNQKSIDNIEILTKRLRLSLYNESDMPYIVEILNNINVSKNLASVPHPYTIKDAKNFYDHIYKNIEENSRAYIFTLHFK